ncbi:MAG: exonuclease subunit SbcD [Chloroflexi bacterium]|nr:exonuclease subunit SbcD [Chloroflexota bacterium]MDA1228764.1 exonuclease subunit SbcD [Chloroflexota bacterium]
MVTIADFMRILHFADLHIGVENYGRVDPETGLSTRLRDFLDTYDELVDYAIDNAVDLVLFCGDAYKSRDPSQTHQREFAKRVARLARADIPVFLLVGNHDTPHIIGRATALEIFDTLDVPNVHIGDTLKTHVVPTKDGPLQVVAVPWIRRSTFLAREETRSLSPDEINDLIQERLSLAISTLAGRLDPNLPAVLSGHVTVSESKTSSEQSMMLGRDHVLLNSNVALPVFDYVALGHIHRHQELGKNPPVVYSGSLQRVDFGEERDDKGFCIIDIDPRQPQGMRLKNNWQFVKSSAREFLTISVKIPEGDLDPTSTVLRELSKHELEGLIVRVQISVPGDLEGLLREPEIRAALESAHFVASVSREILERPRARLSEAYSRAMDPREALKSYFNAKGVDKARADLLFQRAESLMQEQAE